MCFLLSNKSIFSCKYSNLWIFYTESRLSLYKCVFRPIVQRCWSNVKLECFYILLTCLSRKNFKREIIVTIGHKSSKYSLRYEQLNEKKYPGYIFCNFSVGSLSSTRAKITENVWRNFHTQRLISQPGFAQFSSDFLHNSYSLEYSGNEGKKVRWLKLNFMANWEAPSNNWPVSHLHPHGTSCKPSTLRVGHQRELT